jgi:DNA-binding response OmpR family regulator
MRQFRLFDLFMRQPDTALSFGDLRLAIWGPTSTIGDGTVVAEVNRLRNVIGFRYGKNPIKTVRRVGFMFESQPSRPSSRRAAKLQESMPARPP